MQVWYQNNKGKLERGYWQDKGKGGQADDKEEDDEGEEEAEDPVEPPKKGKRKYTVRHVAQTVWQQKIKDMIMEE